MAQPAAVPAPARPGTLLQADRKNYEVVILSRIGDYAKQPSGQSSAEQEALHESPFHGRDTRYLLRRPAFSRGLHTLAPFPLVSAAIILFIGHLRRDRLRASRT